MNFFLISINFFLLPNSGSFTFILIDFFEELPAFYAKRNLLNEMIRPEDIANGVFAFLAILDKSTGNVINVDGGIANAFVR